MFKGNYHFFDYKYNIDGYNGQDFGSIAQYLYLVISIILLIVILYLLRNTSKKTVKNIILYTSIFLIIFYISKTSWESYYDIKLFGRFNTGLLPLDTCSMIMYVGLLVGLCKGKIKDYGICWLATGNIVGGIANMLFLNALKFYPVFTFGAFYSMIWHFLMVFIGLLIIINNYVDLKYSSIIKGFILHVIISLIVIPIDYIFNFDFMLYKDLGGVPIFLEVASYLTEHHLGFFNPVLMLILYFLAFNLVFLILMLLKKLVAKVRCSDEQN